MPEIEEISKAIRERLDKKDSARESALKTSRQIIRECRSAIASLQKGNDAEEGMDRARKAHAQLKKMLAGFPDLLSAGYAVDAEQELAEAEILASCTCGKETPSPEKIGIEDEAFVLGMADSIGEMRRLLLDRLMNDDIEAASLMLAKMERFFNMLMTFDYPDALIATKRKQDVARGLVEKSRGELAMATQMSRLRKDLD
jgi:translin